MSTAALPLRGPAGAGRPHARTPANGVADHVPAGAGNRTALAHVLEDVTTWTAPTWDQVVREHSARVYRLAYRLTGNQHDAEDLTQEVFVRVFRSLADYRPGTFEGWLHRITTNLFLDLVRRRARIRFEGLPDDAERVAGSAATPAQVKQAMNAWLADGDYVLEVQPFPSGLSSATSRASATRRSPTS